MSGKPRYDDLEKRIKNLESENRALKKTLNEIEKSEYHHRFILENIFDTFVITDDQGKIVYCCPNAYFIFGLSQDDIYKLGSIKKLINGDVCNLSELKEKKEINNIRWSIIDQTGHKHFLLINVKSASIKNGTILYVMRDITEYKRIEDKLIDTNIRFNSLFEQAPVGIAMIDALTGRFIDINRAYCHIVGYNKSEILNKDFMQITHPDYLQGDFDNMALLRTGEISTFRTEKKCVKKNGEVVWVSLTIEPLWEKEIEPFYHIVVVDDITERKRAEEALRKSEERLGLALKFSNDGLFDWNLETNQIYYSPGWKSMLGYEEHEIKNNLSEWERLTKPEDVKASLIMWNEILEGKRDRFEKEFQMLHKDGHWVDILSRANIILNKEGIGARVIGTHTNITERKKAEREIIRQKQKAERYLNLAGVMFIGLDAKGNVNLANKKACNILECYKRDIIGRNWCDTFIPKSIRHDVRAVFEQLIKGVVKPVEYYENLIVTKKGKEKNIAWHNTYIKDDEGMIIGILSSGEDITEKRQLQAQLQQSQKMESIGTLAGGIAHDFNNILSSVIGFTELALDEVEKNTSIEDSLQEVYTAGIRAKNLVNQILAFARRSDEEIKPIQPSVIVKEVLKFLRSSIPSTIEITQNIQSDSLIMGNAVQVHQVLMNLCTNAAYAMEEKGGILEVSLKDIVVEGNKSGNKSALKYGDYIEMKVSDTGTGIAPEIIDSIFEPYFTTKVHGEGTGMGLAMVHGIVETYRGKINVNSRLGKGTTFTLYLPITTKREVHRHREPNILPTGVERILFVDDEVSVVRMGSQILHRLGYSVITSTSSIDALKLFRNKPNDFDLIITDMTMPDLTGDKLSNELIKIRPDIPIILCTGYSKKIIDESSALGIGIKAFAYKPIVKADLAKTIRKVLDETNDTAYEFSNLN